MSREPDYLKIQDRGENPGAVLAWSAVMLVVWVAILLGVAVIAW
ncbi:MAG: hypothetical protein DHS20C21_02930 [Gemmatimonadota bacterium]|nr:MAG: hypothetical protein DHS20C21_02930 [Gemmatimonadota bacterium]